MVLCTWPQIAVPPSALQMQHRACTSALFSALRTHHCASPSPLFGALQTRHCDEIMCFGGACHRRYLAERGIKSKCVPYDGTCENGASLLGPARNFPKCYHAMLPKATVAHGDAAASHGAAIATTTLDVPRGSPVQQPPDHTCKCGANAGKCCAIKHSVGLPWHAF